MLPFLLLPGLNCTARVYRDLAEALWSLGPVTIANHLQGDTMAEIAANILALAPQRFALVGFSMGGYIAWEMLRQDPDRIVKLALIDSSARPDAPEQSEKRRAAMTQVRQGKFEQVIAAQFPFNIHPANAGNGAVKSVFREMARQSGPERFLQHQAAIIGRKDSRELLAAVRCPTLVAVGEADQVTPPEAAREMADGIAGAQLVVIAKAGHLTLLEQSEAIAAAMRDWAAA